MRDFTFCANTFLEGSNQSEIRNEIGCYRLPQPPLMLLRFECWLVWAVKGSANNTSFLEPQTRLKRTTYKESNARGSCTAPTPRVRLVYRKAERKGHAALVLVRVLVTFH